METSVSLALAGPQPWPGLPRNAAAALVAMQADETTVGKMPLEKLIPECGKVLSGAALLLAHKNALDNIDDLRLMATEMAGLLQRKFAGLKPAELGEAIRRGAAGEYRESASEVLYLSLPNISAWLYAYQTTARHAAVKALQQSKEAELLALPRPSRDVPAELVALMQAAADGKLPAEIDFGGVLYDWLKDRGCFVAGWWPDGPPDYNELHAEEAAAFVSGPRPAGTDARREFTRFVDLVAAGEWPKDHPLARTVAAACRKRVLLEWIMQHSLAGSDLPALLAQFAPAA